MSKPKPLGESLLIPRQALREHAQAADARWQNSVRAFDPFAERLREMADAAHGQARVILLAQVAANQSWTAIEGAREIQLAAELEGDDRPGPAKLWAVFDRRLRELGMAMETDDSRRVADAFDGLSAAATQIADAIDPAGAEEPDDDDDPELTVRQAG